jgi:hypothetical protein
MQHVPTRSSGQRPAASYFLWSKILNRTLRTPARCHMAHPGIPNQQDPKMQDPENPEMIRHPSGTA